MKYELSKINFNQDNIISTLIDRFGSLELVNIANAIQMFAAITPAPIAYIRDAANELAAVYEDIFSGQRPEEDDISRNFFDSLIYSLMNEPTMPMESEFVSPDFLFLHIPLGLLINFYRNYISDEEYDITIIHKWISDAYADIGCTSQTDLKKLTLNDLLYTFDYLSHMIISAEIEGPWENEEIFEDIQNDVLLILKKLIIHPFDSLYVNNQLIPSVAKNVLDDNELDRRIY